MSTQIVAASDIRKWTPFGLKLILSHAKIVEHMRKKYHPEYANVSFSEKHYKGALVLGKEDRNKPPPVYPSYEDWCQGENAIGTYHKFIDLHGCVKADLLNDDNIDETIEKLEKAQTSADAIISGPNTRMVAVFIERGYVPVGILIFEKLI